MRKLLLLFTLCMFTLCSYQQGVNAQASAADCPDTSGESSFDSPASTIGCEGESIDLPAFTGGSLPDAEFLITSMDTIVGVLGSATTSFDPATYGFAAGEEVCITAVGYDILTVKAVIDLINPMEPESTCCNVLEASIDPDSETEGVLCDLLCETAGICTEDDVEGFQQVIDLFAAFGADPIVDSLLSVVNTLNETVLAQVGVVNAVCNDLGNEFPVCVATSNEICFNIESCGIDCSMASGGSFDAASSDPVCTDEAAMIPSFTAGDLTTTEFLIVDDQNNILGILPTSATEFVPADYGFTADENICLTAINYDIEAVRTIIDAIDPTDAMGTCCGVLEGVFDPDMETEDVLCELLCETAGVCSSADVVGFQQVIELFAVFGSEANIDSLFSVVTTLNETVEEQMGVLPFVCPGMVEAFPLCVLTSNTVCYTTQECIDCSTASGGSFETPADTDLCEGEEAVLPAFTTGELPNSELLVIDDENTIYGILPTTATEFNPNDYGLAGGQDVCVTAINYDIEAVRAVIDAIDPTDPMNTCCSVLETVFDPDMETEDVLCGLLCETAGVCSSADVVGFQQVIELFSVFGAEANIDSLFSVVTTLNETVEENEGTLPFVCPGMVENFPLCVITSNTICYSINVSGCTDPTACNYDDTATCDDDSCILPDGCTNDTACNYDAAATCDDGSCSNADPMTGNTDICMGDTEVWNESTCSYDVDVVQVLGCTDDTACNYDADANCDDESCDSSDPMTGNTDICAGDTEVWNESTCSYDVDEAQVLGCTDDTACNYDADANCDDSSCDSSDPMTGNTDICAGDTEVWNESTCSYDVDVVQLLGCTDVLATNYNMDANCNDGSCSYTTGCTDNAFCNFDAGATMDDGSCSNTDPMTGNTDICMGDTEVWNESTCSYDVDVVQVLGCMDDTACNYDADANCDDSSCMTCTTGCTNPMACNYNADATVDDGSCSSADPMTGNTDICMGDTEVWNESTCSYDVDVVQVLGCTNADATNYDATANCDDASCTFAMGCTDDTACNYDAGATVDDGSCSSADPMTGNTDICMGDTEVWNESTCSYDVDVVQVLGCTSADATNYDVTANCDDASCIFDMEVMGCTDDTACNYNADATVNDGSCTYVDGGTITTTDVTTICAGDGVADPINVTTTGTGVNYAYVVTDGTGTTILAGPTTDTTFDLDGAGTGTCLIWGVAYEDINIPTDQVADITGCFSLSNSIAVIREAAGCTDIMATNYNADACGDDGSCIFDMEVMGCTDDTACNYNADATVDDNSCSNADPMTGNTNICTGDTEVWNATSCSYDIDVVQVLGCTNADATNYNANANCDDGSCSTGLCGNFAAIANVICDDETDTYEVLVLFTGANEYNVTDNSSGTTITTTENNLLFGPYNNGTGFSFTVASSANANCVQTLQTAIVSCTVTSIELLRFDGETTENGNLISWMTASENESDHFTLERSKDGINFEAIQQIDAAGNSNIEQHYNYLDSEATAGIYYYRLLETDQEGKTEIVSDIISLERTNDFAIVEIMPVPATDIVTINYQSIGEGAINVAVFDVTGRLIEQRTIDSKVGFNSLQIDVSTYTSGAYFIQMNDGINEITTRMVKD